MIHSTLFERIAERLLEISERLPINHALLDRKTEYRALTVDRRHFELAAHHRQQALSDVHAEPRAFDRPIALLLNPLERAEEFRNILLLDAYAGVFDFNPKQNAIVDDFLELDLESDGALFGVLDGVGENVGDDLLDPDLVAVQHRRQIMRRVDDELQALLLRATVDHVDQIIQQRAQLIIDGNDLHLARLYLREVENIIDEPEEIFAGGMNVLRVLDGGRLIGRTQDHFVHAEDCIERSSQLVAHAREEIALHLIRLIRHGFFALEFFVLDRFEEISGDYQQYQEQQYEHAEHGGVHVLDADRDRLIGHATVQREVFARDFDSEREVILALIIVSSDRPRFGLQHVDDFGLENFFEVRIVGLSVIQSQILRVIRELGSFARHISERHYARAVIEVHAELLFEHIIIVSLIVSATPTVDHRRHRKHHADLAVISDRRSTAECRR